MSKVFASIKRGLEQAIRHRRGRVVLEPARVTSLDGVWRKIESRGITEKDVEDAVRWARKRR